MVRKNPDSISYSPLEIFVSNILPGISVLICENFNSRLILLKITVFLSPTSENFLISKAVDCVVTKLQPVAAPGL
jgi:hypothetical protein